MKTLSNWRSVRWFENEVQTQLRQNYSLKLHGFFLGSLTLGAMWLTSHLQMVWGAADSLALRYLISLGVGYLVYLLLLRVWAAMLLGRSNADGDPGIDIDFSELRMPRGDGAVGEPSVQSGGGGNFGGGGASGDFAGSALEAAGSADEGAVIVIPVLAVFFIGAAVLLGAGSLLLTYFGWEVLLNVAVELAFSYVSATTAMRLTREGWLSAAVRLTWKPMLGTVVCAVALGWAIDHYLPQAQSFPHAIKLLGA